MKYLQRLFAVVLFSAPVAANSATWSLNDFVFEDGAAATGSFDWDVGLGTIGSFDIVVTDGPDPDIGAVNFSSASGDFTTVNGYGTSFGNYIDFEANSSCPGTGCLFFRIGMGDDLLSLLDGPSTSVTPAFNALIPRDYGIFVQGASSGLNVAPQGNTAFLSSLNIEPNVVPLPAAGWLLFAGLGSLAVMRRRSS